MNLAEQIHKNYQDAITTAIVNLDFCDSQAVEEILNKAIDKNIKLLEGGEK